MPLATAKTAEARVQCPRPDRAIRFSINAINRILGEPVLPGVRRSLQGITLHKEASDAPIFPGHPYFVISSGNGINRVILESRGFNRLNLSLRQPEQSSIPGRKPHALLLVSVNRATVAAGQTGRAEISCKCNLVMPLDFFRFANPQVAVAILEQCGHRSASSQMTERTNSSVRIDILSARFKCRAAGADPYVPLLALGTREDLGVADLRKHFANQAPLMQAQQAFLRAY